MTRALRAEKNQARQLLVNQLERRIETNNSTDKSIQQLNRWLTRYKKNLETSI